MAMYEKFEQFDELEEKFFYIEEEEIAIIAHYVDENLGTERALSQPTCRVISILKHCCPIKLFSIEVRG